LNELRPSAAVWLALAGSIAGCQGQADAEARVEAERVVVAVRGLRDADNVDKSPRLAALRQTECKLADVCELKRECVDAYTLYVSGLDALRAVKKSLTDDGGAADAKGSMRLLDEAEKQVKQGRERAERCATLEGQVAGRYKVK
jgi:hypothetical protein